MMRNNKKEVGFNNDDHHNDKRVTDVDNNNFQNHNLKLTSKLTATKIMLTKTIHKLIHFVN